DSIKLDTQSLQTIDATSLDSAVFNIKNNPTTNSFNFNNNGPKGLDLTEGDFLFCAPYNSNCLAFSIDGNGHFQYDPSLEDYFEGTGTSSLTVSGFDIDINTSNLSTRFITIKNASENVVVINYENLGNAKTINLLPGDYNFCAPYNRNCLAFTVDSDGHVDFASALSSIFSGAGTNTLWVTGFDITLQTDGVSSAQFNIKNDTSNGLAIGYDNNGSQSLKVLPGTYNFCAPLNRNCLVFTVESSGLVSFDPNLNKIFSGAGTTTLTITGFEVTLQTSALSSTQFNIMNDTQNSVVLNYNNNGTQSLKVLPGTYHFCAPYSVNCMPFIVSNEGEVSYDPIYEPYFDLLIGSNSQNSELTYDLIVTGVNFTVDTTDLSHSRFNFTGPTIPNWVGGYNNNGTEVINFLPGDYHFCAPYHSNCQLFTVSQGSGTDGIVTYDPVLGPYFTGWGTNTLIVSDMTSSIPGTLDPDFGGVGFSTFDFNTFADSADDLAQDIDDKYVLVGSTRRAENGVFYDDFGLVRFNIDGTLDYSFGDNGKVSTDFNGGADSAHAIVIDQSNRYILAGDAVGSFGLARYLSTGALDTSFGSNGKVMTLFPYLSGASGSTTARALALDQNNKIIVAGSAADSEGNINIALARYNSDGTLDSGFGNSGRVTTSTGNRYSYGRDVIITADNKIIVAGMVNVDNQAPPNFIAIRYNPNGTIDTSFGTNGMFEIDFYGSHDQLKAAAIDENGRIILVGIANTADDQSQGIAIARLNSDGSLDNSFGPDVNGKVFARVENRRSAAADIAIDSLGRIIISGSAYRPPNVGGGWAAVGRFLTNGSIDESFGADGLFFEDIVPEGTESGRAVIIDHEGKIVIAGSHQNRDLTTDFFIAKFNQ
ncbi:MAG: hypothetical protein KDC47_07595, partial [Flavobacteriaceae bacterium]|nr:hypothetical protein [Flavobacteriaceae bacterium]